MTKESILDAIDKVGQDMKYNKEHEHIKACFWRLHLLYLLLKKV